MNEAALQAYLQAGQTNHQAYLDSLSQQEMVEVGRLLFQVKKELSHRFDGMDDFSKARAITLLDEVRELTEGVKARIGESVLDLAGKAGSESATAHSEILSFKGKAANVTEVMISPEQARQYWSENPIGGNLLKSWVHASFDGPVINKIKHELNVGLFQAESYRQLADRIGEGLQTTRHQLETLIITTVQSANARAMEQVYQENADILQGVAWSAARLLSTCSICLVLDQQEFSLDNHPDCPSHPRCRCQLCPSVDWSKLGLDSQTIANISATPADLQQSGKQWFDALEPKHQIRVVGPTRYGLLQSGAIKGLDDLVDIPNLHIRSLPELYDHIGIQDASLRSDLLEVARTRAAADMKKKRKK